MLQVRIRLHCTQIHSVVFGQLTVLWDQFDTYTANFQWPCGYFPQATFPLNYYEYVADDFVVPNGQIWTVTKCVIETYHHMIETTTSMS